ncbi:DinB family protein [Kribbella sandramycini]|nr:DinB family protein [Kribbella sandramycini]MBB6565820.1 hypothetical protein [Kribbella sandramycini]
MDDLQFVDTNLRGARFVRSDLSGAVMRGVEVSGADIDAPWLLSGPNQLLINDVDVAPYVDAELDRRFPGRSERRAADPAGLQAAWAKLEAAWAAALDRAAQLPAGSVEISVDGEWSFAETLRHLIMATDTWLRRAIFEIGQPYHPAGQPNVEFATDGHDTTVFATPNPSYAEVLEARADRQTMVRSYLAALTPADLATSRRNPWSPEYPETTLSCLHTILEEEWEHLRYALRDLQTLELNGPQG